MKLDKDTIVAAALDLLNEVGIDGLSTRALAQKLGVQQPALYWHFKGKRALLEAMNNEILRRHHTYREPVAGQDWRDFLRENALSFRRALLSHRDGARVHAGTEAEPDDLEQLQRMMVFMRELGFSPRDIMQLSITIGRYIVGCVLEEQSEPPPPEAVAALDGTVLTYPELAEGLRLYREGSPEAHFLAGLELLIEGFAARYAVN